MRYTAFQCCRISLFFVCTPFPLPSKIRREIYAVGVVRRRQSGVVSTYLPLAPGHNACIYRAAAHVRRPAPMGLLNRSIDQERGIKGAGVGGGNQKLSLVFNRTGVAGMKQSERARFARNAARTASTAAAPAAPARPAPSSTCRTICISRQMVHCSPVCSWSCRVKTKISAKTAASVKNAVRTRHTSLLCGMIVIIIRV